MKWWSWFAAAALVASAGCDGAADADAGLDASAAVMDAGDPQDAGDREADSGSDVTRDADGCVVASVGAWSVRGQDDVSITYQAPLSPRVEGTQYFLHLLFNRYDVSYVGEFDLSDGQDANFGSCARCVLGFDVTAPEAGFFVERGTLTLREVPFTRVLDATLTGARLVETMIVAMDGVPTSVPVPGGECLSIAEASVTQTFPADGWTCDVAQYRDGVTCDCGCGAFDPDCRESCDPIEPGCNPFEPIPPLPRAGCEAGEICGFDGRCIGACDHAARTPCESGACGFGAEGDQCYREEPGDRIDAAGLGESCETGNLFCAVTGGFLDGMCDDLDGYLCRPVCDEPADCTTPGDICYTVFNATQGYCRPPAPSDG